jgi:hypothetical protein
MVTFWHQTTSKALSGYGRSSASPICRTTRSERPQRSVRTCPVYQLRRQVYAVHSAAIPVREVARRSTQAAADIEDAAILSQRNPLSLVARGRQSSSVEVLDGR